MITNEAATLQFLKADWEAQRVAFDLARSSALTLYPSVVVVPTEVQTSLDLTPRPEDLEVPVQD